MRRISLGFGILVALGMAPAMFGDVVDYMLNVNGSTYCDLGTAVAGCGTSGPGTSSALTAAGAFGTLDTSFGGTGLGTVNLVFNPGGTGPYNVNLWLFENLATPGYNEYGATSVGSAPAGESWQIDVPDSAYVGELGTPGAGSIVANTLASTLSDTNYVPGTDSSYAGGGFCATFPDPTCNDYVSMALGFNFSLTAGDEEVLSFTVSTTAPTSGFYLEQIHPVDGSNTSAVDYYFSATATEQPICITDCGPPPSVPEPKSIILLVSALGILLWKMRSRTAAVKAS